ncbi:hypothetical protein OBBRIDRAFT_886490 [Obba rivulosa]|uniref:Fanconi-associated nuclease n=1 Tax=Obba rivulosa TaxID=1052685 RepID=A0A8E2DL15_9APHY|nr:hypothetical protein OBBRIDRAFT_886490 [Obba rivulosa]
MVFTSPRANVVNDFVFWGTAPASGEDLELQDETLIVSAIGAELHGERRQSMYVEEFEKMLKTVLSEEPNLFSGIELNVLKNYSELSHEARYLLIRLCLRKSNKWHRLESLKYQRELGDGIANAIRELSQTFTTPLGTSLPGAEPCKDVKVEGIKTEFPVKEEEKEVIDLTLDEDCKPEPGPSCLPLMPPWHQRVLDKSSNDWSSSFADDETAASLQELLECLKVDELKKMVKDLKLKPSGSKRDCLVDDILRSSNGQTTLSFQVIAPKRGDDEQVSLSSLQESLPSRWTGLKTQSDRIREIVTSLLGKCIRICDDMIRLFRRINLVYFRSTEYTSELLVPSILARSRKRVYPPYKHRRTKGIIWPSRKDLLEYERALELQARVEILDGSSSSSQPHQERSAVDQSPGPAGHRIKTPLTPKRGTSTHSPVTPRYRGKGAAKSEVDTKETHADDDLLGEQSASSKRRIANARALVRLFDEAIWPWWQELVAVKGDESARPRGLERFECGHILTRLVCKCSYALGILKAYERELEVLEALLAQRKWRRGRRGRWYERKACILSTHFEQTDHVVTRTMTGVKAALVDDDTHLVFRPKLHRRLARLEKKLRVPEEDRHSCQGEQRKADKVEIYGVRVYRSAGSLLLDRACRNVNKQSDESQTRLPFAPQADSSLEKPPTVADEKRTGKSIWKGRNDEEVAVEMFALQHYANQGYKGFHCEGRIVTTLFGVLFWDIIFAAIPGAFETPFQTAPLDITEDTFYYSRQDLIERRLKELREGKASEIVEQICNQYEKTGTLCVGVRWDLFKGADLQQVVCCLGGEALAVICRLLCEDYPARTSGVPDLIVWNMETSDCRFVEVKGPGDSLQENQKVWIDVLCQAGIPVEVCHVREQGEKAKSKGKKKVKLQVTLRKRKRSDSEPSAPLFVESEDEGEPVEEDGAPRTPRVSKVADGVEVVITTSPKRRRLESVECR